MRHYQSPEKFEKLELPRTISFPIDQPHHIMPARCENPTSCMIALGGISMLIERGFHNLAAKDVWVDENGFRISLPGGMIYLYDLTKPTKRRAKEFDKAKTPEERVKLKPFKAHMTLKGIRVASKLLRNLPPEEAGERRAKTKMRNTARRERMIEQGINPNKRLNTRFV